ncbi:hypothetical protein [Treponema sp.]|uniref:hypothetical protein n=1 Tax=Treponema sp. TaxID=166 RepID=UPI0025DCC09D|nr:hypothetical protein [Treponema sp.]MBR4323089.1 hypothetical protein [Treponema sp.]
MENIRFIICVVVFICTIAGVYARPSKGNGKQALCNPDTIVVSCDIDATAAMRGKCPDGDYFALVYLYSSPSHCSIDLRNSDFTEYYGMVFYDDVTSLELTEKLDAFTYWYSSHHYLAPLIITMKDSHIVGIHSDDAAWDTYARWIGKTFYGFDGRALIN